jgi:mannitol operon transcriptional antiterminator
MTALTTRQRDLLNILIRADKPKKVDDLAAELNLTSREVNYGLKGVKQWLSSLDVQLELTPGVGIQLNCDEEETNTLLQDLSSIDYFQLILSSQERQLLLALYLLVEDEPLHLTGLEQLTQVSRTTVIKDLNAIENWFEEYQVSIIRRPNYGIEVDALENLRQKLLHMLLWGNAPFSKALIEINHTKGLVFTLEKDAKLHPLVLKCSQILIEWNLKRVFGQIAFAEVQLGGRFTDDAFLHLALVFAIQTDRISKDHHLEIAVKEIDHLIALPVWNVAKMLTMRLGWALRSPWRDQDIAGVAMWLISVPRNEYLPADLILDEKFTGLIDDIMLRIAEFYRSSEMENDQILRNGLNNHIIPACLRQKYEIWQPFPYPNYSLSEKYSEENEIADRIGEFILERTGYQVPDAEINNIAALLRAARIRFEPHLFRKVLVVCPGGMASAQLLMSRLEARFPRLGPLKVISMRELTDENIAPADLIISTVPLANTIHRKIKVIQVHPLLLAEDVEAITKLLN